MGDRVGVVAGIEVVSGVLDYGGLLLRAEDGRWRCIILGVSKYQCCVQQLNKVERRGEWSAGVRIIPSLKSKFDPWVLCVPCFT